MDAERYSQVKDLFAKALSLESGARRPLLDRACAGDAELRREVEELLGHAAAAGTGFLRARPDADGRAALPASLHIPGFQVLELLDAGGSGVVYRAEQASPRREVAVKVLRLDALTPSQVARFRREAEILGRLSHPGIAQVFEAGVAESEAGPLPWIAMELVRGPSLAEHVARRRPGTSELLELFFSVCDAVQHAHERGIVHRDLKPGNVLVDEAGRPKVLDFGIARPAGEAVATAERTRTGSLVGTLAYMAPEQARGEVRAIDPRTDVHALGVMLFELITGRLPFELDGLDVLEQVRVLCEEEPERLRSLRPDLPRDLETILVKALEKAPARRYASAGELAGDLRRLLENRPILAQRPTTAYKLRKFVRRNRLVTTSVLAIFLALAAGLVLALRGQRQARTELARTSETLDALAAEVFELSPVLGFGEEQRAALEDILARIDGQLGLDPDNRSLQASKAEGLYVLGSLDQARGDHGRTAEQMQAARAIREELVRAQPDDVQSWTKLADIYAKLGEAARDQGHVARRDEWFARALEVNERLVREHPGDNELVEDLGWSLDRMGALARGRGDLVETERLARRRLADAGPLVEREPDNCKYLYNLAKAEFDYGVTLSQRGHPEEGLDHICENLRLTRRACELQPRRRDYLIWLATSEAALAGYLEEGDEARQYAEDAFARALEVSFTDPQRGRSLELLRGAVLKVVTLEMKAGRVDLARSAAAKLRQLLELRGNDESGSPGADLDRAVADLTEAIILEVESDETQARAVERRALDTLLRLAVRPEVTPLELQACLDILLVDWHRSTPLLIEFNRRLLEEGPSTAARRFLEMTIARFDPRYPGHAELVQLADGHGISGLAASGE